MPWCGVSEPDSVWPISNVGSCQAVAVMECNGSPLVPFQNCVTRAVKPAKPNRLQSSFCIKQKLKNTKPDINKTKICMSQVYVA